MRRAFSRLFDNGTHVSYTEFLPKGYTGDIRKDWCKGGGGVMIATKQEYDIQGIELEANI